MTTKCPAGTRHKLVRCGKPTKPPYTGEKDPGRCSRTKGFCVPPTPDWTCWQHGKDYVTIKNPREFKDCADAVKTFADDLAAEKFEASTQPFLRYTSPPATIKQSGGQFTAQTSLKWRVDASQTIVNLPAISWPNMTAADQAAVAGVTAALQAHEERHVSLAYAYAAELSADAVSGAGATEKAARDALKANMQARAAEVVAELQKRNAGYDGITQHGRTQSKIGGKDTILICP